MNATWITPERFWVQNIACQNNWLAAASRQKQETLNQTINCRTKQNKTQIFSSPPDKTITMHIGKVSLSRFGLATTDDGALVDSAAARP